MAKISSETLEPILAAMIGEYFDQLQHSKKSIEDYKKFWHRISTLDSLTVFSDSTHASLAMSNHLLGVMRFIKDETGQDCGKW